jgi:hypothetical protein
VEHDADLGDAAGQALAGAQVERHARPAARLDLEPDGGVRLGAAVVGHALLGAVGLDPLAGQPALVVLAADGVGGEVLGRLERAEDLALLVRRLSASKPTGSSIAVSASSCSRWFCRTSRAAPVSS